ncbi:hypothetical protein LMG3458_02062 [Achromobacter deleyi]|uniref:DUF551 domain-containing protein n=1 Tax=Achromobacter deleyi TaxID=1353891 RepID=A0A6S6ZWJ2_9BURK|nr:hypothetical protein [Achromobacter deleyi]CAB3689632.1 hypothetical protein LMG3458_02062 [Achromobacter deleyi]CAB3846044.1 hypothetical protein LMG3481_01511 [Achromobacter deleyi]CAB3853109.1 hypothetical protein LMG3482_01874 [Achromobacter deleyi]
MTTIPAGFKLVPIEPTDAMVIEGVNAGLSHKDEPYFIYAAMLAAAPAAPACLTCNDQGAVGIILNAEPCPDCAAPAVPADGWLPIESAPKTGRTLLLGYRNSLGKWRTVRGQWMSFDYIANHWEDPDDVEEGWFETAVEAEEIPNCWRITPTHWMPLPAEPGAAPAAPVSTVEDSQDSPVALDRLADYIADNWPDKKYGLEEICQRLNATWPGAFMPAVAAPAAGDALDAARWRFVRRKLCLTGNGDGTCAMQAINLPASIPGWPEPGSAVAEFCDAAIDAAIAAQRKGDA